MDRAAPPRMVGACSALLLLDASTLAAGFIDGRLCLYTLCAEGSWEQSLDTQPLNGAAAVDGVQLLFRGLLLVGCAGELSVRAVPDLSLVDGCCTIERLGV